MRRLAAISSLLILLALLPIKSSLARIGLFPELSVVFIGATLTIVLMSYAILGEEKNF